MAHDSDFDPPDEPEKAPPRARELASHGPPPKVLLEIPYAIGVLRRNRGLREKLPELRRLRDVAEAELEAAMRELGRAVFEARAHPRASELGTPLRIAKARHRSVSEHQAELARAREDADTSTASLRESIAQSAAALRPLSARAEDLQLEVVVFQRDFEAVSSVINGATAELAAMEKAKSDDADRRIELEAMRTNRRVEVDAALAEIELRTPELTQITAKIAEIERSSERAELQIEAIAQTLDQTKSRIATESAEAKEAFELALRNLADEAAQQRLHRVLAPTAARLARLRYETHTAHARELEMHELALTLYYPRSLRRGLIVLALLCSAVLAWMIYVVVS